MRRQQGLVLVSNLYTLLSAEADAVCGAEYGTVSPERINRRNGYRQRDFDTRAGTIEVAIPKLRQGSYFPEWLLERRKRAAWANCSSSRRAWSILDLTVIVVSFFESVVRDHSKDHAMAVAYLWSDTLTGVPYTTLPDVTASGSGRESARRGRSTCFVRAVAPLTLAPRCVGR